MIHIHSPWRRMDAAAMADFLCKQHGEEKALKQALLEQRSARRARSRKRFDYWSAVSAQMKNGSLAGDCHEPPRPNEPPADSRGGR